jgi:hypothetical protein
LAEDEDFFLSSALQAHKSEAYDLPCDGDNFFSFVVFQQDGKHCQYGGGLPHRILRIA